jgi:hypothetical protein
VAARDVGHEGQAGHPGGQSVPKAWPNQGVQATGNKLHLCPAPDPWRSAAFIIRAVCI